MKHYKICILCFVRNMLPLSLLIHKYYNCKSGVASMMLVYNLAFINLLIFT